MSDEVSAIRKEFERLVRKDMYRRQNEEMERDYEERTRAVRLLDEVVVLFNLYDKDYTLIDRALREIARYRKADPDFQITASLSNYMKNKGYL